MKLGYSNTTISRKKIHSITFTTFMNVIFYSKLNIYLCIFLNFQNERENREVHSWSLVSERKPYRDIQPDTIFQLRQGDVSLLCQVTQLPHFHISEEIIDHDSNKFVLRINSETSV